jgi:OOP family OmpA-OmpF porin
VALGVDCKRLLPVGFGSGKPLSDNPTPEGKAQNRRVTFINAALEGKPIGGMPVDGGGTAAGNPCKP